MTMNPNLQDTIDMLVGDLRPTTGFSPVRGLAFVAVAALATIALVAITMGLRPDILSGRIDPLFLIANGLLLVLGAAAASTAVTMASPQVGNNHGGWRWAAATAALLPLTVLALIASGNMAPPAEWMGPSDRDCLVHGLGFGTVAAIVLTGWVRRGAPASPARAGLLIGVASGSIGMLGFALHCPLQSLYHAGVWHAAPILVAALAGRLAGPRLLRW